MDVFISFPFYDFFRISVFFCCCLIAISVCIYDTAFQQVSNGSHELWPFHAGAEQYGHKCNNKALHLKMLNHHSTPIQKKPATNSMRF